MDVEEQRRAVIATDRRQFARLGNEISIRCLAVGDVDDDRWKSRRVLLTPRLDNRGGVLERGAHRSAPFPICIEPDWKFHSLVDHSAGAVIRLFYPVFDAQRLIGQFTDRHQRAPGQFTAERWLTARFAVAQHTDVKVVVNGVRFRATDAQIMNELVEYRRELLGLPSASLPAAKRVFHRLRLVHQKQETTWVLTTDFGLVWHWFLHFGHHDSPWASRSRPRIPGLRVPELLRNSTCRTRQSVRPDTWFGAVSQVLEWGSA